MFFKNNLHPIAVGAGAPVNADVNRKKQNDAFLFAGASETEDFHSFSQEEEHENPRRRRPSQGRPTPRKRSSGSNKMMTIGIAVAVAVLALVALIVVVVLTSDQHIKFTNNDYIAYANENSDYFVNVNGNAIEHDFEGDVEIIPSADRSFAYVKETTADGISLYLLEGKKLKLVTPSPVTEICCYATLKPGVIYTKDNKFYLNTEKLGDTYIGKDLKSEYCMISGDASTVVYAKENKINAAELDLYIYIDGSEEKLDVSANCKPVAVSNYGDYVYVSTEADGVSSLCYVTAKKQEITAIPESSGYSKALALNRKGDELIFSMENTDGSFSTAIFRLRKNDITVMAPTELSICTVDPSIAIYDSFADTYFTGEVTNDEGLVANPTYHLTKKFECNKISSYSGQFSIDGDYFYYINSEQELIQMDLTDDNRTKDTLFYDQVKDFTVTKKGNVYVLEESGDVRYYKRSTGFKKYVSPDATDISFYPYANTVYFSTYDDTNVSVSMSEEGSEPEIAKFEKTQISNVPHFTQPNSKKSYVYYYSSEDGAYMLYYTSNGKSFELISQNCVIDGADLD